MFIKIYQQFFANKKQFQELNFIKFRFQSDEWIYSIQNEVISRYSNITFSSESLSLQITNQEFFLKFSKRVFVNQILTQQYLRNVTSDNTLFQKQKIRLQFQYYLQQEEILQLLDIIQYHPSLYHLQFYEQFSLWQKDRSYELNIYESITMKCLEMLTQKFDVKEIISRVKKENDHGIYLNLMGLSSYQANLYRNYSIKKIIEYILLTTKNQSLKEVKISSRIDYNKETHLIMDAKLSENDSLQEIIELLCCLPSHTKIVINLSSDTYQRFSNDYPISNSDNELLVKLISLNSLFKQGFVVNINNTFNYRQSEGNIEICDKIKGFSFNQLDLPQIDSLKLEVSEQKISEIGTFLSVKQLDENKKMTLKSLDILVQVIPYYYYSRNQAQNPDSIFLLLQLLSLLKPQNIQQLQHLRISSKKEQSLFSYDIDQSVLEITLDDNNVQNYNYVYDFVQILQQKNQFSKVKYISNLQNVQQNIQLLSMLKSSSSNQQYDINIQKFFKMDLNKQQIEIFSLKRFDQLIVLLNFLKEQIQQIENLTITKTQLKPKKDNFNLLFDFFSKNKVQFKQVDIISTHYQSKIGIVLPILQKLIQTYPSFTISNCKFKCLVFDSDKKELLTQLYLNNSYFTKQWSTFTKLHLKLTDISQSINSDVLKLISENTNLKELILNIQKCDNIDLITKLKIKLSQLNLLYIQAHGIKIYFQKSNGILKIEANHIYVIQQFLLQSTNLDNNLFSHVQELEFTAVGERIKEKLEIYKEINFDIYLIKPFTLKVLKLNIKQSIESFVGLMKFLNESMLDHLEIDNQIVINSQEFNPQNKQFTQALQDCNFHKKLKKYTIKISLLYDQFNLGKICFDDRRTLNLDLSYFQNPKDIPNGQVYRDLLDLCKFFATGFIYAQKIIASFSYHNNLTDSLTKLARLFFWSDFKFLKRLYVTNVSTQKDLEFKFVDINQTLRQKEIILKVIQLMKKKQNNFGLNRAEKLIDLLAFLQVKNDKSIIHQDAQWEYMRQINQL